MKNFSVLMSVYKNSKTNEVEECLDSLFKQTCKSNDIVIVIDGEISKELYDCLKNVTVNHIEVKLFPLEKNVGLGNALKYGMQFCINELVARMDTDDICVLERFERELKYFDNDPNLSIVGSNIAEFIDSKENIVSYRNVPSNQEEICKFMKKRCPFNHMTVMFKKSDVEKAGGYLDWHYNEDSYLWVRMYLAGCIFANINENLVLARINKDTFQRRGGYKYYKSERNLFKFMKDKKIISSFSYFKSKMKRFIVYVLMPNKMRQWAFKKFARIKPNGN